MRITNSSAEFKKKKVELFGICQAKDGCGFWIQKACGFVSHFCLCVSDVCVGTYTCMYTCM